MKKAIVIGGGFAGCTITYFLQQKGFQVTIIEGTDRLGGGCHTFFYHGHPYTLGPHHLLINSGEMFVWNFMNQFLTLRELKHHTLTYVSQDERFYTYPIHEDEIAQMPDNEKIQAELENRKKVKDSQNFEDYWINSVGKTLYNKFIHQYSEKMWQVKNNEEIDEFAFSPKGVALKTGSKQCFEGNKVIAYPIEMDGYNSYFNKCVAGSTIIYNTRVKTFDLDKKRVLAGQEWISGDIVINTASIDLLFEYCFGELRYIGRDFMKIILPIEKITPAPYYYIHYAGDEPYTRIVEYKLLTGYKSPDTLIGIEFPSFKNKLYPYLIKSEIEKANKYISLLPKDCYTMGRMGKYHYDNMDIIIKDSMQLSKEL
jgi:UDP-galactopyranose mutase